VAVALLVFLVYYIVLGSATNLAENGIVSPTLAFWVPNCLMAGMAVLFVFIKGREMNFMIAERISRLYYSAKHWAVKS
jgi:lipopolysaccharide export LptBFGC system permease protein LptF